MLTQVLLFAGTLLLALNLVLTYGALRRLREHDRLLNPEQGAAMNGVGETVAEFTATTTDGPALTRSGLGSGTLAGFFTPGCEPCREKLPEFVRVAAVHSAGRDGVLAVVVGDPESAAADVRLLEPVARVVVASRGDEILTAFGVQAFPSICTLGDHSRIVALGLAASEPTLTGGSR
ncbi:hypothetical protein KZ829_26250 [Actinoplanes hulinensis]|uniref:Redoxin domain-containing protein n=1 Tax=Actinoplanes hulinensis TaxID=1144547 RepID=A0ABS7B8J7_9ACTN|nr:redoxin family protein [Actinoplanes hulinensis]MBW6437242.1 hypothetical protein [Actinoplanes hulinensis]